MLACAQLLSPPPRSPGSDSLHKVGARAAVARIGPALPAQPARSKSNSPVDGGGALESVVGGGLEPGSPSDPVSGTCMEPGQLTSLGSEPDDPCPRRTPRPLLRAR
jgi:hypothetical protein